MTDAHDPERILVVDDDEAVRRSLQRHLSNQGYQAVAVDSGESALAVLEDRAADVVITDVRMPGLDGHELLRRVHERWPATAIIVITAFGDVPSAVDAMRHGASDYLQKPFDVEDLAASLARIAEVRRLRQENVRLRHRMASLGSLGRKRHGLDAIVGRSDRVAAVREQIRQVSAADATTVLIQGETGTGKELVARAIHYEGARAAGPFVAVDCSAVPDTLVESAFYGHERGAFTGAVGDRTGHFEAADGGTLFLDEVGDMDPRMQSRLLRTLEERRLRRLGSTQEISVDARVMAASNRSLTDAVGEGRFREDLFYRLNTFTILVPPLRERPEDIEPLARHFLTRFAGELRKDVGDFQPGVLRRLAAHPLPGNIRELRNRIEHAVILCKSGLITARDLGLPASPIDGAANEDAAAPAPAAAGIDVDLDLRRAEIHLIETALHRTGGHRGAAADLLGISRDALRRRLVRLQIE